MKRYAIGLAILAVMTVWLSGCVLSHSPSAATVTIKVGDEQTFSVTGMLNGAYTWYLNGNPIPGVAGSSYSYTAVLENLGANTLTVTTHDRINGKTLSVAWTVNVENDLPPIADAGPDQNTYFGNAVLLDGSGSYDPEGQPLTYVWEIVGRPAGSSCALDNPNAKTPVFVPDVQGAYTIALIVNDGRLTSTPDIVIIQSYTDYGPPTADAGPDQSVVFGTAVHLDGRGSSDPEGTPLSFRWKIDSGPAGSAASIDDPNSPQPSFMPDKKGVYVVSLVVNNGLYDSGIDLVTIVVYNNAPIANAGADFTIAAPGMTQTLDGSGSSDPDGTALTYAWTIISRPYGSTALLSDPSIAQPSFTPDKKGAYIMQLVVSDGDLSSSADTVVVTCSNQVPVANAGAPIHLNLGQTAQLNGSATDPDGDPMTYAWTELDKPAGSTAVLSNPAILNPTFTPDVQGTYTFALVATDNTGLSSAPSTVTVSTNNHRPVAIPGDDVIMPSNSSVMLDGTGSYDVDGDPLSYTWRVISAPMGSGGDSTLSNPHIAKPTFTPDMRGDYQLGLVVNDGQVDSLEATLKIHVINNQPVADPGSNRSAHAAYGSPLVVVLDGSGSHDPDGDPLTYKWRILSKPAGSTATLSDPLAMQPTLTTSSTLGAYVIGLTVNDGAIDSAESTVTVTFTNAAPSAHAGTNQSGHVPWALRPLVFTMNPGASSDPDGDPIGYTWTVESGSAAISDNHAANPTVSLSAPGTYVIGLVVSDGFASSTKSTVQLTYTNSAPTANAGTYAPVLYANRNNVTLNGGASSDPEGDPLSYTWTQTGGPAVTLNGANTATPSFKMDTAGTYTFSLTVSDGFATSSSTATLTNSSATLVNTTFPTSSDMQGWTVTTSGTLGTYGISSTIAHSASYSYTIQQKNGLWPGSGTLRLTYATGSNYILTISMWHAWQNNSPDTDLYNGTTKVADIPNAGSANTWYNYTYSPNAVLTNVNFLTTTQSQLYTDRKEFIDDIVITYWN